MPAVAYYIVDAQPLGRLARPFSSARRQITTNDSRRPLDLISIVVEEPLSVLSRFRNREFYTHTCCQTPEAELDRLFVDR